MNILLVNYEYKGQGGGAGQQLYYMANAFMEAGHDVSLLIGWDGSYGEPELLDNVITHIIKCKRKNIQLSTPVGLLFFAIRGVIRINKLTKKFTYDIIQFYFSVPTGILKYGIHGKIPYVVSLRGMDIPGLQKNKYRNLTYLTAPINKNITKNAATVICNSSESAFVYKKFFPIVNINVIPNAINYINFTTKTEYSAEIRKFVTVSRLVSWKRIDLLIDTVIILRNKYPNICLDIYGQGYQYKYLSERIIDNKAENYIKLIGYIEKVRLMNDLCRYDMFAFPSTGDSCPNVLLEAMACGLPVIAANAGGSSDLIEDNISGIFFRPNDIDDTIQKMEYCIMNPAEITKIGINGFDRVKKNYSIYAAADKHIDIYNGIINSRR